MFPLIFLQRFQVPLLASTVWVVSCLLGQSTCILLAAGMDSDPKPETPSRLERSSETAYSALWGKSGELWTPGSRLPDFSFAGYHRGEKPLPRLPRTSSVMDYGAQGDGVSDDTMAFKNALASLKSGVLFIPPGRFRITSPLEISRSGVVIRGSGPDQSILYFPKPLNEIKPNWGATTTGQRTSNYSWSGGFISIFGQVDSKTLATVDQTAKRGDRRIRVDTTESLEVGREVEVRQTDNPDNSLAAHLYSGDPGPMENLKGRAQTTLIARITAVEGEWITLDRSLRTGLKAEWNPIIRSFEPEVTECGVEDLGFEYPLTPYDGHFTELGFNPVALRNVAHCWIKNIRVLNADSGPFVSGYFNTIDGVVLESARPVDNQSCTGHHGISLGGTDNLLQNFDIRTRFIHDITVSGFCSGNVISKGRGNDLSLDHHRKAPYENLFTQLDAGEGKRLWKCGGGAALGKHCGARGTFWNIESQNPLVYPPSTFGPDSMNLVGLNTRQSNQTNPNGKWFEVIPPGNLQPRNLYEAQKRFHKHQVRE